MKLSSYMKLISPEYMPMAVTTALLGLVATTGLIFNFQFILLIIIICCIIGGFNSYNAIADKEMDKINRLDRPLPMGEISEQQAMKIATILYLIALTLAFTINIYTLVITIVSIIITIAYSVPNLHLKKTFLIGTFSVAFFYASLCFALGWSLFPNKTFPIEIGIFLFILGVGLSITKDFMDFAGDSFHGAKTLPVKIGYDKSILIIIFLLTIAFAFFFYIVNIILPEKFYVLLIFYPIMISNVLLFRKYSKNFDSKGLFTQIMLLIIAFEIGYVLLEFI
jgi:geranylgeranylglycerol-phosphate geranylgeranyltransferase